MSPGEYLGEGMHTQRSNRRVRVVRDWIEDDLNLDPRIAEVVPGGGHMITLYVDIGGHRRSYDVTIRERVG